MDPKIENGLRRGMVALGNLVESLIGHAKKAKVSVKQSSGVDPVAAFEGQLDSLKIRELLNVCTARIIVPLIPNLVDRSALEMADGHARFSPAMNEKGAAVAVHLDFGVTAGSYPADAAGGVRSIRASAVGTPFEDGFFDLVIANLATPEQGDIVKVVKEAGRITAHGGELILTDLHPFGPFAKKGANRLRPAASIVRGLEDHYRICSAAGYAVTGVKEAFIDESVRNLFATPEEKAAFRNLKDEPFLIFIVAVKRGG